MLSLVLIAALAQAELRIEITGGVDQAVPIAVVPFGWDAPGAMPFDVSGLVAADLERSGRFKPPVSSTAPLQMASPPLTPMRRVRLAAHGWN